MPDWFPDWGGQRAVVVASGPSAVDQPVDLARDRCKVVAINNSWRLAPWADVLYASDAAWWRENPTDFTGLRISRSDVEGAHRVFLRGVEGSYYNDMIFDDPGVVGAAGSSGFQAINLAIQFGARDIALVGFDARVDRGVHWHGSHVRTANPDEGTAAMWAYHLNRQADFLRSHGVELTVCGHSALTAYPNMNLEQWLNKRR